MANIATEPNGGVRVNEFLQSTTNPRVYAAGDAVAFPGKLLFALSIRSRVPATDLKHMVYAYPTGSSDVPYMIP